MASSDDVIRRWTRYVSLGETAERARCIVPDNNRVIANPYQSECYSYGHHFPLVRFVPARGNIPGLFVINGDRWGGGGFSATNRHQEETRRAVAGAIEDGAKRGIRLTSIIVPHSALDGADINKDSIRPIEVRDDRREVFTCTATVDASRAEVFKLALLTREACEEQCRSKHEERCPVGSIGADAFAILGDETLTTAPLYLSVTSTSGDSGESTTYNQTVRKVTRATAYRSAEYLNTGGSWRQEWKDHNPPKVTIWLDGSHNATVTVNEDGTVTLSWTTERHWLGDSLFSAARRVRCGKCHGTGEDRANDGACASCHGVGTKWRRTRFVSSFDYNEPWPLYFLAALPHGSRAVTVDMAIDDLAPAAIHAAYARGIEVLRQGDVFAVATPLTTAEVYERSNRRTRLYMHTHGNGRPRKGEIGYARPLTDDERRKLARERRREYRRIRSEQIGATRQPQTPTGWRRDKRIRLREIAEEITRHETRIANGDNVCGYGCGAYRMATQNGGICHACNRPSWYDSYSVDRAVSGLAQARERYAVELARSRYDERTTGYAYIPAKRRDHRFTGDVGRALSAWRDACQFGANKYTPAIDYRAIRATLAIHGTGHTATEVAVTARGVTYIRGTMRHIPSIVDDRREPDHRQLKLGDGQTWFVAIRNAVPRQ